MEKVVIIASLFLISSIQAQIGRSGYGEFCNDIIRCDKRAWLSCQHEVCDCIFLDEMKYSNETNECVSKAGELCKFEVGSGTLADTLSPLGFYKATKCVAHATCTINGICSCEGGYYGSYDGNCHREKEFSRKCTLDSECRQDYFLSCVNGTCDCNSTQILAEETYCVAKAGFPVSGKACISGSVELDGICICTPQDKFYEGEDGRCQEKKGHSAPCLTDEHCKPEVFLSCIEGICTCDPTKMEYKANALVRKEVVQHNKTVSCVEKFKEQNRSPRHSCAKGKLRCNTKKCILPQQICDGSEECSYGQDEAKSLCQFCQRGVGSTFKEVKKMVTLPQPQCIGLASKSCNPNLKCVDNSACSNRVCVCTRSYVARKDGKCGIGYGRRCTSSDQCFDNFVCANRICKCPSPKHQIYTRGVNTDNCSSLIRGMCETDADCVLNSLCQLKEAGNYRQCRCKPGYVENAEGKCDLAHGSNCSTQVPCDRYAQLECINGVCACIDSMTHFDPKIRKCLGLEGTRCKPDPQNDRVCLENASCVSTYSPIHGSCLCNKGFVPTEQRFCQSVNPNGLEIEKTQMLNRMSD